MVEGGTVMLSQSTYDAADYPDPCEAHEDLCVCWGCDKPLDSGHDGCAGCSTPLCRVCASDALNKAGLCWRCEEKADERASLEEGW